jgi:deazaflavin-dependent oxidoreductase (nitroreductase family)
VNAPERRRERHVLGQVIALAAALVAGLAALGILFVLGMRARSPLVQRPIVWFSKRFMNPKQMKTAGTPGAYAAVIRTVGRTSGRPYATPIGAVADGDAFVIGLPYGTRPQWLRNLLAAGGGTLDHEGATYDVDRPEVVPLATVAGRFSPSDQRSFRIFNVTEAVRVHRADALAAPVDHAA